MTFDTRAEHPSAWANCIHDPQLTQGTLCRDVGTCTSCYHFHDAPAPGHIDDFLLLTELRHGKHPRSLPRCRRGAAGERPLSHGSPCHGHHETRIREPHHKLEHNRIGKTLWHAGLNANPDAHSQTGGCQRAEHRKIINRAGGSRDKPSRCRSNLCGPCRPKCRHGAGWSHCLSIARLESLRWHQRARER